MASTRWYAVQKYVCAYVYMYINIVYISDTKFSQLLKKHLTKNPLFQKAMHVSEKS